MKYTVRVYKHPWRLFAKTYRNVVCDFSAGPGFELGHPCPVRILGFEDGRRLEIPAEGTVFEFSKERDALIRAKAEREASEKNA